MKKYFWLFIVGCGMLVSSLTLAGLASDYGKSSRLEDLAGERYDQIRAQNSLSRFDLAEFLVIADCNQCIVPSKPQRATYTDARREETKAEQGNNFDELGAGNQLYKGKEYSYCVAEVANEGWMNGFPRGSSPFCPGKFCGSNTLVYGDLLQAVINSITPDIYRTYTANRSAVRDRVLTRPDDIDIPTRQVLQQALSACTQEDDENSETGSGDASGSSEVCERTVGSIEQFGLYVRYCRHNLAQCGMQSTTRLQEGSFPSAIANILVDQEISTRDELEGRSRYDPVDGALFLGFLEKLTERNACQWDTDYDKDGASNSVDVCPNVYDPSQRDTDNDGEGDVCDDDIDGDTILNERGVIDDRGNIDPRKVEASDDNCVFTPNTDQLDEDADSIGDACQDSDKACSFRIDADPRRGDALLQVAFESFSPCEIERIERDFGDGGQDNGEAPVYIYDEVGVWTAKAVAIYPDGKKAVAKIPITVTDPEVEELQKAPRIYADLIVNPKEIDLGDDVGASLDAGGDEGAISAIIWDRCDGERRVTRPVTDESGTIPFVDRFVPPQAGICRVSATIVTSDNEYATYEESVSVRDVAPCATKSPEGIWGGVCDMDDDGVADRCDDDIDGDGAENLIGIIIGEPENCDYPDEGSDEFDDIVDPDRREEHDQIVRRGGDLDNCFLVPNADQSDTDADARGDVCDAGDDGDDAGDDDEDGPGGEGNDDTGSEPGSENSGENLAGGSSAGNTNEGAASAGGDSGGNAVDGQTGGDTGEGGEGNGDDGTGGQDAGGVSGGDDGGASGPSDRDGDGLVDARDGCPDIPENADGYEDTDGCPEAPRASGDQPDRTGDPYIDARECSQCPCQFANYESKLMPGDRVKAVLVDPKGEVIYSHSAPELVPVR